MIHAFIITVAIIFAILTARIWLPLAGIAIIIGGFGMMLLKVATG